MLVQAVNKVTKDLRDVLTQVRDTSNRVAVSSRELTASTEQTTQATEQISTAIVELAEGSDSQLASIMRSSKTVTEITYRMDQASQLIQNMANFSVTANDNARFGTQIVSQTIEQMKIVQQTFAENGKCYSCIRREVEGDR